MLVGLLAALFVVAGPQTAAPVSEDHLLTVCLDRSPTNDPDARIAACTALIGDTNIAAANRVFALEMRGNAYQYGKQDFDHALDDYNAAISLDEQPEALVGRGDLYVHRRDFTHAIADFSRAIELDPTWADAYRKRGATYSDELHDYEHAISDFNEAIELGPASAITHINRANAYVRGPHDYLRAIEDYNEALRLAPGDAVAIFDRGLVYYRQKDFPHALADFERDLQIRPTHAPGFVMRGLTLGSTHQFARALADIDNGAAMSPSVTHDEDRCWIRAFSNQDLDVALRLCNSVIQSQPHDANALLFRAVIEMRHQQWESALTDMDAALVIEPNAEAYLLRGICALRLGRGSAGQADIDHAAVLDPSIAAFYAGFGITP